MKCSLKKQKYKGQTFIYYCTWYGFGRMLIEGLRTDSLYIGSTGIRVSQLLGFALFAVGAFLIVYFAKKYKDVTHEEYSEELKAAILGPQNEHTEKASDVITSEEEADNKENNDPSKEE